MNTKPIAILAALAFFTGGCSKSPTSPTANNSESQPPPPVQAEPFHGQVYKSLDGRTVITLVSKDECELNQNGTILLCKYTKPNGTLRIVTTALGTSQVVYLRITDQGLEDNSGNVLYSPGEYAIAVEQLQRKQQEKEKARLEEQRRAEAIAQSRVPTKKIGEFQLSAAENLERDGIFMIDSLLLFDTELHLIEISKNAPGYRPGTGRTIEFGIIKRISNVGEGVGENAFIVTWEVKGVYAPTDEKLHARSEADAHTVHDAVLNAFNAWKAKFPEAVLK